MQKWLIFVQLGVEKKLIITEEKHQEELGKIRLGKPRFSHPALQLPTLGIRCYPDQ